MQNMEINSVKLVNQGAKGIILTYALASDKGTRSFIDEHTSKKKAPIHEELEVAFESLRRHLLDICAYESADNEEGKYNISRTEITGVTYNNKGFVLCGKYKILGGDKTINLVTPLLKDGEDYESFPEVCVILDNIYAEVKSYMAGEKTFSDEQLVIKFNAGKEDFDAESFKAMSKEEKRDLATSILEEMGSIVMHGPEMETEPVEETTVTPTAKMEVVENEPVDDFELEEMPDTQTVKTEKKSSLKMVEKPNGSFKIVAQPTEQKVSTAKRKTA